MAEQKITTFKADGLFKPAGVELQKITSTSVFATFSADISDGKDSIIALIDVPAGVTNKITFIYVGNDTIGEKQINMILENGKLNVIHLTTKGFKCNNGVARFGISTDNMNGLASHNIGISFLKYRPVVNH